MPTLKSHQTFRGLSFLRVISDTPCTSLSSECFLCMSEHNYLGLDNETGGSSVPQWRAFGHESCTR